MSARLNDKYAIDDLLGQGGMASVYSGTHRNGHRVAIKMLHAELSAHEETKRRFLREGYVANAVDHPGVVRIIDDDVARDGRVFLVMELLAGETLSGRAERLGGRLPPIEVLQIVDQVLSTLQAAHAKSIFHRDIKPENLFLTADGQVKLLDFGIARMREIGATATSTGTTMGTPAFMAPEQALGRTSLIDGRTDLWSLGATMFTLLTGELVHPGKTGNEHLILAATTRARAVADVAPDVPGPIQLVVDRALAFEAEGRFQDAAKMQAAVRDAYAVLTDGASPTTSTLRGEHRPRRDPPVVVNPATPRSLPPRRSPLFLVAGVGVVVVSALTTLAIVQRRDDEPRPVPAAPGPPSASTAPAAAASSEAPAAASSAPAPPASSSAATKKRPAPQTGPKPLDMDRRH